MARLLGSLISLLMIIAITKSFKVASAAAAAAAASELDKIRSPALFIFGDSSVDSGNNNYIYTIPENQANYEPYGRNGFFGKPTGRFSDGRVVVDFIAEYAKLPLIPPFLQPSADYLNGVNFASGGAGALSETNKATVVIDLKTQLKNFEEVEKSLTEKIGDVAKVKELISEAVYFVSIGSNDYMGGYLGSPKMQELYTPEKYVGMVIGNLTLAIQELYTKGGRKFAFLSLVPLGCLPVLRAHNVGAGGCLEEASALALAHNAALNNVLSGFQNVLKGFKYCNLNTYNWLEDRMNNPSDYGFKDGVNACCGSGPYGGTFACGGAKNKDYDVCDNADEYVWWDSYHPTERLHEQLAKAVWNGSAVAPLEGIAGSYHLENLFFFVDKEKLTIADIVDDPENEQTL